MRNAIFALLVFVAFSANAAKRKASPPTVKPLTLPSQSDANEAFTRSNHARAITLYTALLASKTLSQDQRANIYVNRGFSNIALNRSENAIADLKEALQLNPNDIEAANALSVVQGSAQSSFPAEKTAATAAQTPAWGPLVKLPGHFWMMSITKPIAYVRYEWVRVGISMMYAGKDVAGNRIEGQYFLDPATSTVRGNTTYRGKVALGELSVGENQFTETGKDSKGALRQISQLQIDGTFNVINQRYKRKEWQSASIATLSQISAQMVDALGWPSEPPVKQSLWKGIGQSLKAGAIAGFHDGMRDGVHDVVQDRVRRVGGVRRSCRTISGDVVPCP